MTDWKPSCAICGCRATPEFPDDCHHEAEALTKALHQALERSQVIQDIKDWVIDKAKRQIGRDFEELRAARHLHHKEYVQRLPCYSLYQRYANVPNHSFPQLQQLKFQMAQANQVFAQGVDEDWRRSCMQYPSVLDHFFSLVEVQFPDDEEPSTPPPAPRKGPSGPRRGSGDYSHSGHKVQRKKERRRSRARTRTPTRAPSPPSRFR